MTDQREIVLVNMPFAQVCWPNLGLGLLQAGVKERGLPCRTLYLNFWLAEQIGYPTYAWIAENFAFALGGERLFAAAYFGQLPTDPAAYHAEVLSADPDFSPQDAQAYAWLFREIDPFLDAALAAYPWQNAALVGFATTFQQTLPSLALAKRIKRRVPEVPIAFGGAACEDEMGLTLLAQFPELDYVFLGEADETFPELAQAVLQGRTPPALPGVVSRQDLPQKLANGPTSLGVSPAPTDNKAHGLPVLSATVPVRQSTLVTDLDGLPYPDFDDYFATYWERPSRAEFTPILFFEMSRGCWWGEKHHCVFCGLNGQSLRYRRKSPRRVVDELRYLVHRHQVSQGCAADNILDFRAFETLLPALEQAQLPFRFACELKANLKREQIERLLRAGLGAAQLGIETFDSDLLRNMNKGVHGYQNLQTLKWFAEARIDVDWNFLYGFPWETEEKYRELARLVKKIRHLPPPLGVGRVRMDRFSPFFEDPERFGMKNPRASRAFRHVFPFPQEVLNHLAYYYEFDADWESQLATAGPLLTLLRRWQADGPQGVLSMQWRGDGRLLLLDSRQTGIREHHLAGWQAELYVLCDAAQTFPRLCEFAGQHGVKRDQLQTVLRHWLEENLMLRWDDRFLSLAVWTPEQSPLYQAAAEASRRVLNT